jgi:arylsulfatase A-like enzyme
MDLKAYTAQTRRCPTKDRCRPFVQLFDLQNDPYELHNLAQGPDQRARVTSLSARLHAWMEEVDDPLLAGPLRTPYYERAMADFLTTGTRL